MSHSRAVLITGCSTGIGRATARRLASRGWPVWATARRPETLGDLEGCRTLALDVTDDESMAAAVKAVEAEAGAVGVLINNAGYAQEGAIEEVPIDAARRQFETNVFGAMRLCQMVLPGMRGQRWGRIVNISSVGGRLTFPGGGWYHATKHALEALSDALRYEVTPFGVNVIVVQPGLIKTAFGDTAAGSVHRPDGPYASFTAGVEQKMRSAYSGALGLLAAPPEAAARTITRAVEANVPLTRYRVTIGAPMLLGLKKVLPDAAWDLMMRTQFPRPKPED